MNLRHEYAVIFKFENIQQNKNLNYKTKKYAYHFLIDPVCGIRLSKNLWVSVTFKNFFVTKKFVIWSDISFLLESSVGNLKFFKTNNNIIIKPLQKYQMKI